MNVNKLDNVIKYARENNVPVVPYYLNWPYHLRSNIFPYEIRKNWKIELPKKIKIIKFMGIEKEHDDVKEFNNVILKKEQSENKLLEFVKTMTLLDGVQNNQFSHVNKEIWNLANTCKRVKQYNIENLKVKK